MPTREQFIGELRDALNHLYDPDRLQSSPLAGLFGVESRFDTSSALQRILIEAIESLEPGYDKPSQSDAWRIYESLFYRYVEQLSQQQVADRMGVSTRHFRRRQHASLEVLANLLWDQFHLRDGDRESAGMANRPQPAAVDTAVNEALTWLKNEDQKGVTDLNHVLPTVVELSQKLANRHAVRLEADRMGVLPSLSADPVAVRQILLNLMSVAIPRAAGGYVRFRTDLRNWEVEFRIRCREYPSGPKPTLENEAASLAMSHQLADLCRGTLILDVDAVTFDARLILPRLEQMPVLVVDDNTDTLQLLQRYASGSRYRLISTRDPGQVVELATEFDPQVIVLDVMMPHIDGWEVLGNLRQHPLTKDLPIIVCTILAQEEFAFLLGASAFLRKPITRPAFLAALDQAVASPPSPQVTESR